MSRFILNLRSLDSRDATLDMSTASALALPTLSLHWPGGQGGRISATLNLANIGAPLDFHIGVSESEEDEEENAALRENSENTYVISNK